MAYDFVLPSDRAVKLSGEFDYENESGGSTFYYGDSETVSASSNIGSVTAGNSLTRRESSWVISAGTSYVSQLRPTSEVQERLTVEEGDLTFSVATQDEFGSVTGAPGSWFFVASDGSDTNTGADWDNPLATITAAIAVCTSGAGDRIYVKPGTYAENVVVNKDYVSIIGAVEAGYARPDIVPASGLALSVNNCQGVVLKHLRFASDGQDADVARNESNGFVIEDCVFDGDSGMAATKAALRLWCDAADDSFTSSEGKITDCLFRNSAGYGIAFDVQHATVGVGPTHNEVEGCRFLDNTAEDVIALATAAGTYSIQDSRFRGCSFMSKNKATHVDISTNNGATNTGNVFEDCFFFDDTIDTTAIKAAGTGSGFIGCYSLDGLIDGDLLD